MDGRQWLDEDHDGYVTVAQVVDFFNLQGERVKIMDVVDMLTTSGLTDDIGANNSSSNNNINGGGSKIPDRNSLLCREIFEDLLAYRIKADPQLTFPVAPVAPPPLDPQKLEEEKELESILRERADFYRTQSWLSKHGPDGQEDDEGLEGGDGGGAGRRRRSSGNRSSGGGIWCATKDGLLDEDFRAPIRYHFRRSSVVVPPLTAPASALASPASAQIRPSTAAASLGGGYNSKRSSIDGRYVPTSFRDGKIILQCE